jgi:hypothetical protein
MLYELLRNRFVSVLTSFSYDHMIILIMISKKKYCLVYVAKYLHTTTTTHYILHILLYSYLA